jgi:glucoamylase
MVRFGAVTAGAIPILGPMPRALTLGNGRLLVNLDDAWRLRDIYYPSVGAEHHAGGPCRLGFWVDGAFAWSDDLQRTVAYEGDTLVTSLRGESPSLALAVHVRDAVDFECDIFVREIELQDLSGRDREVRVFLHHDLNISGTDVGDTAFYEPELRAVLHYKGSRYFLVNGRVGSDAGVHMFTAGRASFQGFAGSWADAEDGELSGHAIEQGAVDSCVGFVVPVPAHGVATMHAWLCVATAYRQVVELDRVVRNAGAQKLIDRTRRYWRSWVAPAAALVEELPEELQHLYARSLLIARSLCDDGGGVIASTDRDILEHARDTYCYVWPRDGALVTDALDRAGFSRPMRGFLHFCANRFGGGRGYLLHKFLPDGALGSSWHPWFGEGGLQIPIQQDETALVVWALGEHHLRSHDREFVKPLYRRVVEVAGDFMATWRDPRTGLPHPSWDLWEERRGVHAFTIGAVHGGLAAAARLAEEFGETDKATHYLAAADGIRRGADEHLWDEGAGRFARQLVPSGHESGYQRDLTVDASLYGLFAFGMYAPDDPRVVATMQAVRDHLWVRGGVGGVARYQHDYYQCVELSDEIPGNPWIICTLWVADWLAQTARSPAELDSSVLPLLEWVARHASAAGVLPEQVHPFHGTPLSVAPLSWSHAAFVSSCLNYTQARAALQRGDRVPARSA